MKKTILTLITLLTVAGLWAQESDLYHHKIAFGVGASYLGGTTRALAKKIDAQAQTSPVYNLDYEYLFVKNFALGVSFGYQNFFYNVNYEGVGVNLDMSKLNASINGKFYFANSESFRMFLGLKIGASFWDYNLSLDTISIYDLIDTYLGGTLGALVKPFLPDNLGVGGKFMLESGMLEMGFEKYFTPNLGLNAQLAFGSPYWGKIGISYRFNGPGYSSSSSGTKVKRRIF